MRQSPRSPLFAALLVGCLFAAGCGLRVQAGALDLGVGLPVATSVVGPGGSVTVASASGRPLASFAGRLDLPGILAELLTYLRATTIGESILGGSAAEAPPLYQAEAETGGARE